MKPIETAVLIGNDEKLVDAVLKLGYKWDINTDACKIAAGTGNVCGQYRMDK